MQYLKFREKLKDYLADKLEKREAELLREHLESCRACSMILDDVRATFTPPVTDSSEDTSVVTVEGYRIIESIGKGGMGHVFRAVQLSMERDVALKVLSKKLCENKAFIQRFQREARSAGRLGHPNLIRVYDFGKAQDTYFFSMEYIDGKTVRQVIREDDRIGEKWALEIAFKVAEALAYAIEFNIIHRDIKPDNIMLASDGEVKVADMGLAKQLGDEQESGGGITMVGERLGTPYYMSPEQIRETRGVDHRADIYSLGATLFHMLTGRRPFEGDTAVEIMQSVVRDAVTFNEKEKGFISQGVRRLILEMLEKNPRHRPQKWKQLVRRINGLLKTAIRDTVKRTR